MSMEFVSVVSGVLGVVGALVGISGWFAGAVKKSYAAEREFMHIKALINESYSDVDKELGILSARVEKMEDLLLEISLKIGCSPNRNPQDRR